MAFIAAPLSTAWTLELQFGLSSNNPDKLSPRLPDTMLHSRSVYTDRFGVYGFALGSTDTRAFRTPSCSVSLVCG